MPLPIGYVTYQNHRGTVTARYKLSWQALQKQLERKWRTSKLVYGSQRLVVQTAAWSFWVKVGSKYYAGSITDCATLVPSPSGDRRQCKAVGSVLYFQSVKKSQLSL